MDPSRPGGAAASILRKKSTSGEKDGGVGGCGCCGGDPMAKPAYTGREIGQGDRGAFAYAIGYFSLSPSLPLAFVYYSIAAMDDFLSSATRTGKR